MYFTNTLRCIPRICCTCEGRRSFDVLYYGLNLIQMLLPLFLYMGCIFLAKKSIIRVHRVAPHLYGQFFKGFITFPYLMASTFSRQLARVNPAQTSCIFCSMCILWLDRVNFIIILNFTYKSSCILYWCNKSSNLE
jgi:hypothetical protein